MGNCVGAKFLVSQNDAKFSRDEVDKEPKALSSVDDKIDSLVRQLIRQQKLQGSWYLANTCSGHKVKIVVTKEQLQLLMRKAEELKQRRVVLHSGRKLGTNKRWQPSLEPIPEL
ncbi:X-ray repair cross complementing 3 [Striga asiatica]|uniref:X-ray repair cross complementing 3 n=1 Tax=Striga asiatica TaxID=4170 RepID=A0A5A7R6E4_STRAF|nr:X-ray repair cross complementing 3 [Striga asiatica]